MPDVAVSGIANASGAVTVELRHNLGGIQWNVWQISVETLPFRLGARIEIRRNGRFVTSSVNGGQATAQGPPALIVTSSDVITAAFTACTSGDECVVSAFYEEVALGSVGTRTGLV